MKKKVLLLSLLFLFFSKFAFSQINPDVLSYSEGRYYYQNKIYKHNKLAPVLEVNPKAHEVYKEYLSHRRIKSAALAFAMIGGSVLLINGDPCRNADIPEECDLFISESQVVGGIAILGSVILGIASFSEGSKTNQTIRRSVKIFNNGINSPVGYSPIELNLQTTNYGIGLVLNF